MMKYKAGSRSWSTARNSAGVLVLSLFAPAPLAAQDDVSASRYIEQREMSGASVIGNREVPKSLYIVPWRDSEVGVRTGLSGDLLDEDLVPVDPHEFERQVHYYEFHNRQ